MTKAKTILTYLTPSFVSLGILILDIFISDRIHLSYYATHSGCGYRPSALITIILALLGLFVSMYGVITAFRQHHKWLGAMAILLTLLVVFAGLLAFFILEFEICF